MVVLKFKLDRQRKVMLIGGFFLLMLGGSTLFYGTELPTDIGLYGRETNLVTLIGIFLLAASYALIMVSLFSSKKKKETPPRNRVIRGFYRPLT